MAVSLDTRQPVHALRGPHDQGRLASRRVDEGVGWSAMHSGAWPQPRLSHYQQHKSKPADGSRSDHISTRYAQQKHTGDTAYTRAVLPPTPPSTSTSDSSVPGSWSSRHHDPDSMESAPRRHDSGKLGFTTVQDEHLDRVKRRPFQQRHGRRYTRDATYPLPCNVPELQRQNLRTSLACTVFGKPVCSPEVLENPPSRVLDLGCGTGYWSASCHEAFAAAGHHGAAFTGMDIVPVAPDLRRQGVNWNFLQHDMRRVPWPFDDNTFELIMWKDLSLVVNMGQQSQRILDECIRVLRVGGVLEIWEFDNLVRCMQPHTVPSCLDPANERIAAKTATFPLSAGTPFCPSKNRYMRSANKWIDAAVGRRDLASAPCTRMAMLLLQEPESLGDLGVRRVAVPLSCLDLRRDAKELQCTDEQQRSRSRTRDVKLSRDQLSLRQTALLTVVQLIESLEPLLKEASGKNDEEWSFWWASMMEDFSNTDKKSLSGECLEIGAWWATKLDDGLR